MKIGIVGYGVVGRHMVEDVRRAGHCPVIRDPWLDEGRPEDSNEDESASEAEINACDAAFVCVGTPQSPDGECDLSAIAEVFSWLRVPVAILRSTVPPGTLDRFAQCPAVFCPEFIGEGVNSPYNAMRQPPFMIIGGKPDARTAASAVLSRLYNSECEFIFTDAVTAEVAKYAENYFLALKVSWANELYDICAKVGADFGQMMAAVTHDYRIGRSHTHVHPADRGWGGRCLPKDTAALLHAVGADVAPLLAALRRVNDWHVAKSLEMVAR